MKVHFIAIGGSAMHNLAIALSRKGFVVTGSDDEIFEPSKGRLKKEGILPEQIGWNDDFITADLDAVILGMHARADNPELAKAKELGLQIFSYPEYIYEQAKNKKRVVIGGSHGKTTITSMILHALQVLDFPVDYMVGAQLEGYDCMVKLTEDNDVIILEGDEYLSSPIDRRPKFHLYKPHVALISGIAWDHINVFPTYENYVDQFDIFCNVIKDDGILVYNEEDADTEKVALKQIDRLKIVPYSTPKYEVNDEGTIFHYENQKFPLKIFGAHNLQNLYGALNVVAALGIAPTDFLNAMKGFTGAGKRLEKISETPERIVYKDFAHSPSKLKATTSAVKEQYPDRKLVACMELHTFSSLKKDFLPQYKDAMKMADKALVYFSPNVVKHKKLDPITKEEVYEAFGKNVQVETETEKVLQFIEEESTDNMVLLMMSSGNFDGVDYSQL
ncbi:peptidoglycan synthetase [Brumimicrobium glaciale]|uniref:Peptidoglycan synthetase n=1 Tax=Brumimicrobium glaciale TaxID=200475 RepID=A0A4Q4KNN9_9FLAO|nr:Mur ligase family protein [Brumimicrobium glaciale]RYM34778.1 peptidoglycan synthetase [Brumimicrobium glaciale]